MPDTESAMPSARPDANAPTKSPVILTDSQYRAAYFALALLEDRIRAIGADAPAENALHDVISERERQQIPEPHGEGFDANHDDKYKSGELADAAASYIWGGMTHTGEPPPRWPWQRKWWKPKSLRENLVRAAALLITEIERIDRAEQRKRAERVKIVSE